MQNVQVYICDQCEREVVSTRGLVLPKGWYELVGGSIEGSLHFDGHGCLMSWAESK